MQYVTIGNLIGCGKQGKVYHGFHRDRKGEIVIKKFNSKMIAGLEATVLQKAANCPYIPQFYELIEEDETAYILMEHVQGASCDYLVDLAQRGINLTEAEIRCIIRDTAKALKHLHERNIVYGDLKPSNVMFIPPSKAMLVDFGCAREGTEFMRPLGTPLFYAPEKFAYSYSFPSDVWSLGVFMYMLTCGIHPYAHRPEMLADIYELEHEVLVTKLGFHHPKWDLMSDECKHLVQNMLQKNPDDRYSIVDVLCHPWINLAGNTI